MCSSDLPNETEAAALTGIATETEAGIREAAAALLAKGCGTVIVTLGAKGALVKSRGIETLVPVAPGTSRPGMPFSALLFTLPGLFRFFSALSAGVPTVVAGAGAWVVVAGAAACVVVAGACSVTVVSGADESLLPKHPARATVLMATREPATMWRFMGSPIWWVHSPYARVPAAAPCGVAARGW